jgi:glycosyltransferase involved in cell wall biosynthesis
MRVALIYDHINKIGGAEQILVAFHKIYPDADWYTSFWDPQTAPFSRNWHVHSFPYLHKHHEWFPWLMSFIFESFDLRAYDLVISIGSAESKGVITRPGTVHLNYCLTPTRYLYSHASEYLSNRLYQAVAIMLRKWDLVASTRPDEMIAISTQVKSRIKKYYNRDADIIFPPVNTKKFNPKWSNGLMVKWSNYYLTVARLVKYKRIDKLIEIFNENGKTLVIVGEGSDLARLKRLVNPNIIFVGPVSDPELVGYYQNCRAFVQANEEDFGIAMCESLASGKPVIARSLGGALDIVQDGSNGILVQSDTLSDWQNAVVRCERIQFSQQVCKQSVARFDQVNWTKQIKERIDQVCQQNQR